MKVSRAEVVLTFLQISADYVVPHLTVKTIVGLTQNPRVGRPHFQSLYCSDPWPKASIKPWHVLGY